MIRLRSLVVPATCGLAVLVCASPAGASLGVVTWGRGLGAGKAIVESNVPVPVCALGAGSSCTHGPYLQNVVEISAGDEFDLALLSSGKVVAWGKNESGQLGDGTTGATQFVPVEVHNLSNVKAISAGSSHSLALLSNGTVMTWAPAPMANSATVC
jgi:Regulator of chromosome condensation (RCC1) repeat